MPSSTLSERDGIGSADGLTSERKLMLTENDVIEAVVLHLQDGGWNIENTSSTVQRGFDILARKGQSSIAIEAKGETSSKCGTNRFGKPFNGNQRKNHVSRALYEAATVVSNGRHKAGIALPCTEGHIKLVEDIAPALTALNIVVFLVQHDRTVRKMKCGDGSSPEATR